MQEKVKCPVCGKETTKEKKEEIFEKYPEIKELLEQHGVDSIIELSKNDK